MSKDQTIEVDTKLLKKRLSRLNRHAFAEFITGLFNEDATSEGFTSFSPLTEAGEDIFFQPYLDSYGMSIHRVFLMHTPPLELFHPNRELKIDDPSLINRLVKVRNIYKNRRSQWGMVSPYLQQDDALKAVGILSNITGIERSV